MRALTLSLALSTFAIQAIAADPNQQVHDDKKELAASDVWIYNDLDRAFAEARAKNKPLLIVYRCIP